MHLGHGQCKLHEDYSRVKNDSRTELRQRTELRLYKWLVAIPFVSQFRSGSERNCDYTTFGNTITGVY